MSMELIRMIWRHRPTAPALHLPATAGVVHRLIISAPFGNYVQPVGATATLGTFTLHPRPGRFWQMLKTVRYYPRLQAWVNQIGLRNPGVEWLLERVKNNVVNVQDKIISLHGFEADEWYQLLDKMQQLGPLAVELNMSCPNVGEINWPTDLFTRAMGTGLRVIVKLPPVNYQGLAEAALSAGVRTLHGTNTLPIPAGGLSGKPLKPVALQCIRDLRTRLAAKLDSALTIIGGGGITSTQDIDDFRAAGADHFAVGTFVMNPICLVSHARLKPLIRHADSLSQG